MAGARKYTWYELINRQTEYDLYYNEAYYNNESSVMFK